MKSATEYLWFDTKQKRELVNITDRVQAVVEKSGIAEGLVLVSAMHITAGVFVNDHEPGLWEDIWAWLQKLAPEGPDYHHHRTGEDNGDAHLESLLVHHEVTVPIRSPLPEVCWARRSQGERRGLHAYHERRERRVPDADLWYDEEGAARLVRVAHDI